MKNTNIIDVVNPVEVQYGQLYFDWHGNIQKSSVHRLRHRPALNKMVALTGNGVCDLQYEFQEVYRTSFRPDIVSRVFVTPECKLPRDLYRTTGFKLTYDRDSADWIVLPDLPDKPYTLNVDLAAIRNSDNTLFLFTVNRRNGRYSQRFDDDYDRIKDFFGDDYTMLTAKIAPINAIFIPKCDEYRINLTADKYSLSQNYIFEKYTKLETANEISVETLEVWKRLKGEMDLLARSIVNSNWQEYPVTLCVFLYLELGGNMISNNKSIRYVLDSIGYSDIVLNYRNLFSNIYGRTVTPKDWNMLQDYVMHQLNVEGDKGFTSPDKLKQLGHYAKFVRSAFAVSSIKIDEDMVIDSIPAFNQNLH